MRNSTKKMIAIICVAFFLLSIITVIILARDKKDETEVFYSKTVYKEQDFTLLYKEQIDENTYLVRFCPVDYEGDEYDTPEIAEPGKIIEQYVSRSLFDEVNSTVTFNTSMTVYTVARYDKNGGFVTTYTDSFDESMQKARKNESKTLTENEVAAYIEKYKLRSTKA